MAKNKQSEPEQRIYIIVPEKITIRNKTKKLPALEYLMEHGRAIAQAVHVARKLESQFAMGNSIYNYEVLTTIVLSVRNSKELALISNALYTHDEDSTNYDNKYAEFSDTNPNVYGTDQSYLTAIAFGPTTAEEMEPILGHLELWRD
jgi:hypothetical protein